MNPNFLTAWNVLQRNVVQSAYEISNGKQWNELEEWILKFFGTVGGKCDIKYCW